MNYQTETAEASAQFINQNFVRMVEGGSDQVKTAEAEGSAFIREIVRQASNFRDIIEPIGVDAAELDRDERTDDPKIIVEKEPDSIATYVELQGTPSAKWYRGPRYAIFFSKIMSPEYVKSKFQLLTYRTDIRKLLADNSVKDMADQEDKFSRRTLVTMANANPTVQRNIGGAFSSAPFVRGFKAMYLRRRPLGKMLMTKALLADAIDLPATGIGNAIAEKHWNEGIENESRLFGLPVVGSVKPDIWDPREVFLFSPSAFLGKSFLLQDATLFIKTEADKVMFHTYLAIGTGIGNRLSFQHILFN